MLWLSIHQEPSKQQNEIHSNSRTGNIAINNNATTLVVADSAKAGQMVDVTRNVCARTSHYVGFDRQSHDFD